MYCCSWGDMARSSAFIFGKRWNACFVRPTWSEWLARLRRWAAAYVSACNAARQGGEKTLLERGHPSRARAARSHARPPERAALGSPMTMSMPHSAGDSDICMSASTSGTIRKRVAPVWTWRRTMTQPALQASAPATQDDFFLNGMTEKHDEHCFEPLFQGTYSFIRNAGCRLMLTKALSSVQLCHATSLFPSPPVCGRRNPF